ncbi:hypothetical protein F444_13838 [Phytophthora nicotianae P1976]|uniref:Uncharacterized protein n=1 Tax=Phytophthora nicotianae P1976 TaxID=1317066 RepID=A0A080ZSK4_PHYNI|nr:hypothetical protein F444_13838 [Phytophthora nicotianae P1976]
MVKGCSYCHFSLAGAVSYSCVLVFNVTANHPASVRKQIPNRHHHGKDNEARHIVWVGSLSLLLLAGLRAQVGTLSLELFRDVVGALSSLKNLHGEEIRYTRLLLHLLHVLVRYCDEAQEADEVLVSLH